MSNTSVDTLSMNVGTLRVTVKPLLQTRISMTELLIAHAAGCTFAFVCNLLCADSPLAASTANLSTWRGNVVHEAPRRHRLG